MQGIHGTIHPTADAATGTAPCAVSGCPVCGSREVQTDEVVCRGRVLLAECRHCDHRWTRALPDGAAPLCPAASVRPEAAPEAGADAEVATAA